MFEILKTVNKQIVVQNKFSKGSWINVITPTADDEEKLLSIINLPKYFLEELHDKDEQPRVEADEDIIGLIVRVPLKKIDGEEIKYSTRPMGIVFTKTGIITISHSQNDVIEEAKKRNINTTNSIQTALNILLVTAELYSSYLGQISKMSYQVQRALRQNVDNIELARLSRMKQSLVYFATSLKGNIFMMDKFIKRKGLEKKEEYQDIIRDITVENVQSLEMTRIDTDIVHSIMNTSNAILSNNLNQRLKTLTSLTIILMIPTLIASIYGMNVTLPFADNPKIFFWIVFISVFFCLSGYVIFRRKDLF